MIIALTITTLFSIAIATTLACKLHQEAASKARWQKAAQQRNEQITELKIVVENLKTAAESRERITLLQSLKQQSDSAHHELRDILLSHLTPSQRDEFLRLTSQEQQ